MDHRNVYGIPELDPTDNDVDNMADQRLESSMENNAETLRDTNDRVGFDGSWIGVPDTPKSQTLDTSLTKVMPDEIKMEVRGQLSTNYNLEDLDEESLVYINKLFAERYKQWKSDLHHHFQVFDDPQVALHEGCPKELEGREDSWAWLCVHFQAPNYVNKAQVNKGNRKKKTFLHHSGSKPFSYRMDARWWGGSKFPEIDVFGDVYVRPGNELAESLHVSII
ncbi:unnamed protein product [Prunus brigantina]